MHEVNNKLGSIILNSEMVAANNPESESPAADIVRNATDLLEMTRDMESALPGNLGGETSLHSLLVLASRLLHGTLRKRKIELVLPELDGSASAPRDHLASLATMLLVPLAFPRNPKTRRGILRIQFADDEAEHHWKVELDPPMELDAAVCGALDRMCRCHRWKFEFGRGWLTIATTKGSES